ncbi:MAG: epoxyqueuosine reductase QueH [Bilifractor sp.]|nr:epoxyqueuosine reductase QueH [Lachnospiraceae bacterium]MDY2837490.1 epoxyqueuosine reductase QueH [Bilifractor sp.]
MNQKINYQKKMEQVLAQLKADGRTPRLLLHSCCAPCSSYVLEYLSEFFYITDFYYNPNISPADEYRKRVNEMQRLIREMPMKHPVEFVEGIYDPDRFYEMAKGKEDIPEGGERCFECFEMRLREAAREAVRLHMDYFTTSLSISPLKDAQKLNEIGIRLGKEYGIPYLASDFKKKNGFRRSTELSREYNLYRQNYCGCVYSKRQAEREGRA